MPHETLQNIKPREYQNQIYETCKNKNCLVVLPTGIGKTLIALMLSIHRIKKFPGEKILFLAPTRPLAEQHLNYFKKHLPELFSQLDLFTGKVDANKRKEIWQKSEIIFSTPQCIANDLKNNLYSLEDVSLLVEDECHRCLKNYSYTYVVERYKEQAKNQRILGMTASPGTEKKIIQEVAKNLDIEAIEIRTRESSDVKEYLQELEFEIIKLDFPSEFEKIRKPLQVIFNHKIDELKNRKLLFVPPTKKFLLETQHRIMRAISSGNKHFNLLMGASACAQALKIQHALELLETQTLYSLQNYLYNLFSQAEKKESRAVQNLVKTPEFNQAFVQVNELLAKKVENPKLIKLKEIIEEMFKKNERTKVIVFSQYRDNVTRICKELNLIHGVNAKVFIGQASKTDGRGNEQVGLSQKEQQEIIREFSLGNINILCATSIGEEGLDIPEIDAVIFYEPVPSAIRTIQRCLPANSRILMNSGEYKKIADISIGDKVISYDEKIKQLKENNVSKIFKNGMKNLIEIITEKGNKIKLTENHPILTPKGWVDAKRLNEGDLIALGHTPNTNINFFSLADFLPEETYLCNSKELRKWILESKRTYTEISKKLASEGYNINKKTLWSYAKRDAIPIKFYLKIAEILKIPKEKISINNIKSRKGRIIDISKINLSEFMWLLGIIASDGDLRKISKVRKGRTLPHFVYKIRICNSNNEIVEKVKKIFEKVGLKVGVYEDKIETNNTIIGKMLNILGLPVKGKKSKTLEMAPELFKFDNLAIESFLSGIFDGDGNFNKSPCQIRLGTGSEKFAFQLQSLLLRIGINSKICKFDKTETRIIKGRVAHFKGDFFSVEVYKKEDVLRFLQMREIVKVKSPNIKIYFSKNSHKEKNIFWVKIGEIKKLPAEEVYNLEVKNNNTFIAENIIVHNSGRTARMSPGKIIILLIKKTRDEAYYWSAFHKEKKMYKALESIKDDLDNQREDEEDESNQERKQKTLF